MSNYDIYKKYTNDSSVTVVERTSWQMKGKILYWDLIRNGSELTINDQRTNYWTAKRDGIESYPTKNSCYWSVDRAKGIFIPARALSIERQKRKKGVWVCRPPMQRLMRFLAMASSKRFSLIQWKTATKRIAKSTSIWSARDVGRYWITESLSRLTRGRSQSKPGSRSLTPGWSITVCAGDAARRDR